ncbi:META domain-containing protein [Aestuariimicrobium ganziense]|uniref:hypothetical protein n=1 Tax=Aestuariimicrobium ganziense TaxID=2773677 RepID=UPI0019406341|nr:hypothetical protein [Aestuariimicrobium ganziense]
MATISGAVLLVALPHTWFWQFLTGNPAWSVDGDTLTLSADDGQGVVFTRTR